MSHVRPLHGKAMLLDLRYAIRTLVKNPAFSVAAVICLALGIGVNATIFSCLRALLLRPFPYHASDALIAIGESNRNAAGT